MKHEFKKGLYRFELVIEREGENETITLYRTIANRSEANGYSKALLDLCEVQGMKWRRVEWTFDEYN
jgi:hypothetical protein